MDIAESNRFQRESKDMETGGGRSMEKIEWIRLYQCGYCENQMSHIFKQDLTLGKRKFPALVVLIKHKEFGHILFDTGYSKLIYQNGLFSKLYNWINPAFCNKEDTLVYKLNKDNIHPGSIKKIILSHAHPDHMGGLNSFYDYELIATLPVLQVMKSRKIRNLVFTNMIPSNSRARKKVVKRCHPQAYPHAVVNRYADAIYDILGDGSILGVGLEGHSEGQMGLYLPEYQVLFAADACWGEDLMEISSHMKVTGRMIQNDFKQYLDTINWLHQMQQDHPEIKILFSHGSCREGVYAK